MAYAANEFFREDDLPTKTRTIVDLTQPKTFASVGAAPLYKRMMPVAFDTVANKWKIWASGGANGTGTIKGFIYQPELQIDAANDVLGIVLIRGTVHYDDIVLPAGETAPNLKTALRSGLRELGIDIQGLDQVR